ncbi:hypothetical protein SB775_28665, partial [Peribacillus sp. SIMBA_075]
MICSSFHFNFKNDGDFFMLKVKRPFDAYLDEMNKITILLPHAYGTSRTF